MSLILRSDNYSQKIFLEHIGYFAFQLPPHTHTQQQQDTIILLFLAKHYTIKTDIIIRTTLNPSLKKKQKQKKNKNKKHCNSPLIPENFSPFYLSLIIYIYIYMDR